MYFNQYKIFKHRLSTNFLVTRKEPHCFLDVKNLLSETCKYRYAFQILAPDVISSVKFLKYLFAAFMKIYTETSNGID